MSTLQRSRMGEPATDYEIICYSPGFRDRVLRLQQRSWGPDLALNSSYFQWKYEDNPFGDQPLVYLALLNGELIGMRGFWDVGWKLNGSGIPAVCAGDLVVTREHENKGLFGKIMRFAEADLASRGYRYLLNLSASPVTFLHSLRNGWQLIQPWQSVSIETGPWARIRRMHQRMIKLPFLWRFEDADYVQGILKQLHRAMAGNQVGDITISNEPRADAMAAVAARNTSTRAITHAMDADYLRWRFRGILSEYQFFYAGDDEELQGYLVMQTPRRASHGNCAIVDWQADNQAVKKTLIEAAVAATKPAAISIWTANRSDGDKIILKQAGFTAMDETRGMKRYQPGLLIKALQNDSDTDSLHQALMDPESWDLLMLYSDKY